MSNAAYNAAMQMLDLKEIPGDQDNPQIVKDFTTVGASWYKDDETPWCGGFHGARRKEAGFAIPPSGRAVNAQAWYTDAQEGKYDATIIPDGSQIKGDTAVFTRNGGGHVGFYVDENTTHIRVLGGNQSNKGLVSIASYPKRQLTGYVRPNLLRRPAPPPVVDAIPRAPTPIAQPAQTPTTATADAAIAAASVGLGAVLWNALGWVGLAATIVVVTAAVYFVGKLRRRK